MNDFTQLVDLASERVGGRVLAASDEFFAPKENLLKASKPVFLEDKYTDRGKWMDGWETRRRRGPGHDWCIIQFGLSGIVRGVVVDTSHFKGNFPEQCSLDACALRGSPGVGLLTKPQTRWVELLPKSEVKGDTQNHFPIDSPHRFTHLRFYIYPDGGVARLCVYGEAMPDWKQRLASGGEIDLAAAAHGGRVLASSDKFFSAPQNLLLPGRAAHMGEGWETRRRRGPGFDWVIVKLGIAGTIRRIEVDTAHFKGNFPESCSLEACATHATRPADLAALPWREVLGRTRLQANRRHRFEIGESGEATHVRFNIFPDGGVSRLRIFGSPSREARLAAGLEWLHTLLGEEAEIALRSCCGSTSWARRIAGERPFENVHRLLEVADRAWTELDRQDWLEAFSCHPRIGEKKPDGKRVGQARRWSGQEQSAVRKASARTLAELAEANRVYQARFGYIFIVCVTGKSADEMLVLLRQRLANNPETELRIAAEEQRRITRLRLEKLLSL